MYVSTKTYSPDRGYTVSYRQHRAESHCNKLHGYALGFHFEFESDELDVRNWVVDFGSLKTLKDRLDEWFDHTCLVATDDPEFNTFKALHTQGLLKMVEVERTGCEGLSKWLFDYVNEIWLPDNGYAPRVRLRRVEVRETGANSASYEREVTVAPVPPGDEVVVEAVADGVPKSRLPRWLSRVFPVPPGHDRS